ncbi:ankyrin repeat-containing domain protein [Lactarius pseudohatsudake]|nr:ankyrin repeat-containing domain protein [Lactarius pseudohatsudake]
MSQNIEAAQFLSRIATLPRGPVSLDHVLHPSLDDEAELRKLFATDKGNARLSDIHVGLVDVFATPSDIRTTRARVVKDDADRDAQHIMALPSSLRREEGSPAMVESLEAFKKNWGIFTENSLSQLVDWSNVIAAGGSVQACLMPLPKVAAGSKRAMRKYFHEKAFPSSDVDLFLYGLTVEEAERKIVTIYEAVRDSVPWDVTCVRTKHTVSIHSQYPYRSIQIVLRLYSSPAEVLTGFDVDAPCCAYDGDRVWANPRAIVSMMRQSNIVDVTRRSPSYEVRLAKYSSRGFEVYVPGLKRDEIDPTIYERAVGRVQGLARLLAIEKLATPEARNLYQYRRSLLRGRPVNRRLLYTPGGRKYKGDLKTNAVFSGLEMSDYDVVNLHIPYGTGWDARRIERLIYKTDYSANSPYNPKNKNRRLHRHCAFFGTVEECIEDCCELCPEPKNEEEHNLQDEDDKSYVRGRIAFVEEDPGRQSISGSFNPIDEGEWSETAYVQATAKFFGAISKNDVLAIKQMIEDGEDLTNRRDHVGRTPLHVAILSNSVEVGCVLVDAGARMTARLVGGRTSLHLAAQMGQVALVKKVLERSAYNKEKAEEEKGKMGEAAAYKETDGVRMSSEDDWSSDEKGFGPLEDDEAEPDVLDISIHDWDFGLTALAYAIISGSVEVVDALLAAGADPCFAAHTKNAISSTADGSLFTIFHRIVAAGKTKIVASLLSHDPNAKKVLNSPAWYGCGLVFPVVSTIMGGNYATLSVLLAHGAKLVYLPEDLSRAEEKRTCYIYQTADYRARIYCPIETALCQRDEVISLLAALGADVDAPIKLSYTQDTSLLQWTSKAVSLLGSKTTPTPVQAPDNLPDFPAGDDWSQYRAYLSTILPHCKREDIVPASSWNTVHSEEEDYTTATKDYFTFAESVLRAHGATLPEAPTSEQATTARVGILRLIPSQDSGYTRHSKYSTTPVPVHLKVFYDELYEACWKGDNASVRELCLPKQVADEKEPIQIVVQTAVLDDPSYTSTCWTPLVVALHRRHWDTARLVLAIAKAQYQPPDTEMDGTNGGILRNNSDSDEEGEFDSDADDSGDYSEEKPINFTDIAARPSSVRTDVPPKKMLELQTAFLQPGLKRVSCNPLQRAIIDDDFEAFVHILNLYEFAGAATWPDSRIYDFAVALDRPDMLDELIRRSGVGIPIPSDAAKASGADSKKAPEERVYLGLKVGGKRRTDIVNHRQTQHKTLTYNYDLLRSAIKFGATNVIDYLAGPRPTAAFTHYAETHDNDIAQYLKSIKDLSTVLPDLLGWKPDELNESPLLCAVIDNKIDVLKQLFELKPNMMEEALHLRVRTMSFNPLLAAAYSCIDTEIVDLLLEKGCDPSERDFRGWNIYHIACLSSDNEGLQFVEHLLKTLPEELTRELMTQTSREASNTPLMLAIKRKNAAIARVILEFGIHPSVLLLRDPDGSTPLHVAVQNADTVLAEVLLKYGPTQLLYTENCVGQTPLDIASLKGLPRVTGSMPSVPGAAQLPKNAEHHLRASKKSPPFNVEKQKIEIPKLRATLDMLLADGLLAEGTTLMTELLAFANRMEGRLAIETARKNAAETQTEESKGKLQPGTAARMYFVLRDAAAARPGTRQLVHLADVQRSVQRNLAQHELVRWVANKEYKEPDPEVQRIAELKARSLFSRIHGHGRVNVYVEDTF